MAPEKWDPIIIISRSWHFLFCHFVESGLYAYSLSTLLSMYCHNSLNYLLIACVSSLGFNFYILSPYLFVSLSFLCLQDDLPKPGQPPRVGGAPVAART